MIQYFFGDDTITARERIAAFAKEEDAQIRWVDKDDIADDSLESILDIAQNSLFGKVVAVFRDPSTFPEHTRAELLAFAEKRSFVGEIIVWDRTIPDARLSFTKKMKKAAHCEAFLQPNDEHSMVAWGAAYAKKQYSDMQCSPAILTEIVRRVGNDVSALASEVAKCSVLVSPTLEDITRIVPERGQQETSAFPLLEAIITKRAQDAVRILGKLIDGGSSERFILSMLAYQFRLFLAVRIGRERGVDISIIHRATAFHPVAIQKAMPVVSRISLSAITEALVRIGATEKSINTSSMDPRSMVTMLVVALSR